MISAISILLEYIFNYYIKRETILLPLFTLVSIVFIKKDDKYLIKCVIIGFIYDVLFTSYYIINMILFLLIGFLISIFYKKIKFNYTNNIFITIFIITIYQLILFILFNITGLKFINIYDFVLIARNFYLVNIIYTIILTFIKKRIKS